MLHVRLVVPAELRPAVAARVEGDETICNLTVLDRHVRQPSGDLFLFDLPIEAANLLLEDLKALRLHVLGSIALHRVDSTLSATADRAERLAHGDPNEAVIWDEVEARVGVEAHLSPSFLAFLVVATLIGAIAVLTDSPVLVIGAMVVGPEFGPLAACMLSVHRRQWRGAGRALLTLAAGFSLAGLLSFALTLVLRALDLIPAAYLSGSVEFTRFISHPDLFSVLVALLAGVAGVLSLTESRGGTLVGVLISVTTIPALANIGVATAVGDRHEAIGACLQLAANLGCLLAVGVATLTVQERLLRDHGRPRRRPAAPLPRHLHGRRPVAPDR